MPVKCVDEYGKSVIGLIYQQKKLTIAEIAEEYCVSIKTVKRVLKERGLLNLDWRSEIRLTEDEANLIKQMREQLVKPSEMTSLHQLKTSQVFAWFRKRNASLQKNTLKLLLAEHKHQQKQTA